MLEMLPFIQNFVAEFALSTFFIAFGFGKLIKPVHSRSSFGAVIGALLLLPFYSRLVSFGLWIDTAVFFAFFLLGVMLLFDLIKYRAYHDALAYLGEEKIKPQYGLNDTLSRINDIITIAFFGGLVAFISLLPTSASIRIVAVIIILLIISLMSWNSISGYKKHTTHIDARKVKVTLSTLLYLSWLLTFMVLLVLFFTVKNYIPSIMDLLPLIAPIVLFLPLFMDMFILKKLEKTMLKNKTVAKLFINKVMVHSVITLAAAILVSDVGVVYHILNKQDLLYMIGWTVMFVAFCVRVITSIMTKCFFLKLKSRIVDKDRLNLQLHLPMR